MKKKINQTTSLHAHTHTSAHRSKRENRQNFFFINRSKPLNFLKRKKNDTKREEAENENDSTNMASDKLIQKKQRFQHTHTHKLIPKTKQIQCFS